MELWRRPFPATDNEVRTYAPIYGATEVCIYPKSRLVSVNRLLLFQCVRPAYPFLYFEKEAWRDLLGATTHVALKPKNDGSYWIFLTHTTNTLPSFTHTEAQPFGIWTELLPVQIPLALQRVARSKYDQMRLKILTWATASIRESQIEKWFRDVLSNADLVQIIIRECLHRRN